MRANHITVCVCTFKRADLLTRTLAGLEKQATDGFTYSVVVADNDSAQSARPVADKFAAAANMAVQYCVEPQQNIALVRNRALQHARGEFAAFIDDDEVPEADWLLRLIQALKECGADGILGPVKPYFDSEPPIWVKRGKFFDRPNHPAGYKLKWAECRTGNVLFRTDMLSASEQPFRIEFGTAGEDMDFYRRMIDLGRVFRWCPDAVVYELVPPERCRRSFLLKRALLRGSNFPKHPADRIKNILKSVVAIPSYALALPVLAVCGQHIFLKYLIKLFDHASRLLAFLGWSLVNERQA